MALTKLYDPKKSKIMRVAGFMSGTGTNPVKIIEHGKRLEAEKGRSPYEVVVIFSEKPPSPRNRIEYIGQNFRIPIVTRNMTEFYERKDKPINDLSIRPEFDTGTVEALKQFNASVAAYAGYMKIATDPLIKAFLGVNVHPADLSIMEGDKRKYTGDHAVRDAIKAGETEIRATTHLIEPEVDYGRILMISPPVLVNPDSSFDENQDRLKEKGDWVIFPQTLEWLADGRYSQDEKGNLHFDSEPIPNGVRLE